MTRRLLLFVLSFTLSLGLFSRHEAAAETTATLTRGPYLQLATPNSIAIVWRVVGNTIPSVRYGRDANQLENEWKQRDGVILRLSPDQPRDPEHPRLHSAPANTMQIEAHLTGLEPNTKYYYAIYDGDTKLFGDDTCYFVTHPASNDAQPLHVWVVGDSGTGGAAQAAVHASMRSYVQDHSISLDMFVHVGDMAYSDGTDDQFQNNFFKVYEPTLRHTVCWPAIGNHEGHTSKGLNGQGPYFDGYVVPTRAEAGGVASGTEAYYSFDYAGVHFISLDSHDLDRKPEGAMAQWLKADLEKVRSDWIVCFFHHPPYTKGSHDSDTEEQLIEMRQHIMPILEEGGVDLVLTGHSHIYERSMLMDGAYATPTVAEGVILDDGDGDPSGDGPYRKSAGLNPHEGTVQVVTGHGGADLGRVGTMPVMKRVIVEHGSTIITVHRDVLSGIMINTDGTRRDLFTILKQGRVVSQRVTNPRQLAAYTPPGKANHADPHFVSKPPEGSVEVIGIGSEWHYLVADEPSGDWTKLDYDISGWKTGPAGFGYGDNDDLTDLTAEMKGKQTRIYLRHDFDVGKDPIEELGLVVNFDDAFICYINGQEVLRVGVGNGRGQSAEGLQGHEAEGFVYYPLQDALSLLRAEDNIIAIEGHNEKIDSSDFSLDPYLVMRKKP